MTSRSALVAALLAVTCASASASGAGEPPLPLTQVDVSNSAAAQAETTVAVDPSNPKVLLAGSNNESLVFGTLAYTSTDGGAR